MPQFEIFNSILSTLTVVLTLELFGGTNRKGFDDALSLESDLISIIGTEATETIVGGATVDAVSLEVVLS